MPAAGIIHYNVIKVILKFGVCAGKSHQMIKQWLSLTTCEYSRLSSERRGTRRGGCIRSLFHNQLFNIKAMTILELSELRDWPEGKTHFMGKNLLK